MAITVDAIKTIYTKKQELMAFVTVGDATGVTELIVFPRTLTEHKERIVEGALLLVSAKVSTKDGETKLICQSIIPITEENMPGMMEMLSSGSWVAAQTAQQLGGKPTQPERTAVLEVLLRGKPSQEMVSDLRDALSQFPGKRRVCLVVESAGALRRIETEYAVAENDEVVSAVAKIVGADHVRIAP